MSSSAPLYKTPGLIDDGHALQERRVRWDVRVRAEPVVVEVLRGVGIVEDSAGERHGARPLPFILRVDGVTDRQRGCGRRFDVFISPEQYGEPPRLVVLDVYLRRRRHLLVLDCRVVRDAELI